MTLTERIRRLASRATGMSTGEIPDRTPTQIGSVCGVLERRGELHKFQVHRRLNIFFTDPALRDALAERVRAQRVAQAQRNSGGAKRSDRIRRAPWDDDAPIIIPAGLVIQRCPGFTSPFVSSALPNVMMLGIQRGRVARASV